MVLQRPAWQQPATGDPAIEYSALEDRASVLAAMFSAEGVLDVDAGQLQVTQRAAGANFSVDIAAGRCAIQGDDISDQGIYLCTSTVTENRAIPAAPASGTHQHRVVARVRDKLHNGAETTYDWVLEVLADTGTGMPALPGSAIHLATVTVAAGATAVTDADIVNAPPRASVGTLARTGAITPWTGWNAPDVDRQPGWSVTPSGWVLLTGFIRRSAATFTATAGTAYVFAGPLPAEIRTAGYRDLPGMSSQGAVLIRVLPNGNMDFVFMQDVNETITQNATWFSLDGLMYRLDP